MTGRGVVLMGLALVAAPVLALADHAVPRESGSSSSSSAGSSHHSSGSSSGSSSGASSSSHSGSSSSSSDSTHSSPSRSESSTLTDAQRRHPRAGTGHGYGGARDRGYRDRGGYYYGSSYYYGGYPYSGRYYGSYGPSWYGYDYWYSPYYYSGNYGYSPRYYRSRESGSLRLQVQPEKTRVYVDGYYAGVVDDFDGLLQRLYLPPGRHEVTLKLEGYRSHTFKVYVPIDQTIKVHHEMVRGEGEGTTDVVGGPVDYARLEDRDQDRDRAYDREDDAVPDDGLDRDDAGSLRLRVQPGDASVYVDGRFHGAGRDLESLRLSPGRHRVEVVRPGYRTVEREVEVSRGRSAEVEVELRKE